MCANINRYGRTEDSRRKERDILRNRVIPMKSFMEQLYFPYVTQLGMKQADQGLYREYGRTFSCDPSIGNGFFWAYQRDEMYALCVYNLTIQETVSPEYDHPEFFSVGMSNPTAAEYIIGRERPAPHIIGYTLPEGTFKGTFVSGTHVNSVGITFSPEFVKALAAEFSISYPEMKAACFDVMHSSNNPDAECVMKQVFAAHPKPGYAAMYYEGKILELLSILLQWSKRDSMFAPGQVLPAEDLEALQAVVRHLEKHYGKEVSIHKLEKVAYMGRNKLSHIFKRQYGTSIMEYLRNLRIDEGKKLLLNTRLSVDGIASSVGYANQGAFAERFKLETGLTPMEYRALICAPNPAIHPSGRPPGY